MGGEMYSNTKSFFYDLETKSGKKKVFAFMSYPNTPKPKNGYPAVLLIHGGNGQAYFEMTNYWANKGFVTIAPDFNGRYATSINARQRENLLGGNSGYGSIDDLYHEDTWMYFSVLSAMRAIDVLIDDSEVDSNNIFSCGLSWGGVVQLLLSSIDKRIKAASVIYSSAYILDSIWGQKMMEKLSEEDKKVWNSFIDPKNYLKTISSPMFFTAGTNDVPFKMENRRRTATDIIAPVYFGFRKQFKHANFFGFEQNESIIFFKFLIENKPIIQPSVKFVDGVLKATKYDLNSELFLVYTNDDVVKTERQEWIEVPIKSNENIILNKDISAFFVIEKDKNNCQWSTNIIKIK